MKNVRRLLRGGCASAVLGLAVWVCGSQLSAAGAPDMTSASDAASAEETDAGTEIAAEQTEGKIYIENICVNDMTGEEISAAVEEKFSELTQETVNLYLNGTAVSVTAGELGLALTNPEIVSEAASFGSRGNVLQRYHAKQYMEENGSVIFDLNFTVSADTVRSLLEERVVPLNSVSADAQLTYNGGGSFTVIPEVDGVTLNVDSSVEKIVSYMTNEWHGGTGGVSLEAEISTPEHTTEQLSLVQDMLGTGSTSYDAAQEARSTNLTVATGKINGTVLMPGEQMSVCDTLMPFTEEEGYKSASAFELGAVVDDIGGGVCQVSSTLYRAVLEAELTVIERKNHSMAVDYVQPSLDAAIAEGSKDFVFENSTDAPIYIEGYIADGTISFTIYGHETRDPARTVEYTGEKTTTEAMTYTYGLDSTKRAGRVIEVAGNDGGYAVGWKTVYVNGAEESKEQFNSSYYQMRAWSLTIGTRGATEEELAALEAAVEAEDRQTLLDLAGKIQTAHSDLKDEDEEEDEEETTEGETAEAAAAAQE